MNTKTNLILDTVKGFGKGVRFHWLQKTAKAVPPSFITYQVTNRCNAKCSMCNIWKKGGISEEMTLDQITNFASDQAIQKHLTMLNLTGGEPFLREDLQSIIDIFLNNAKNLNFMTFATNGSYCKRVTDSVNQILSHNQRIKINIGVSLDGDEKLHNQIRGVPNLYKKAVETVKTLKQIDSNRIHVQVRTTITPSNIDQLKNIYANLKNITDDVAFNLAIVSSSYYSNEDDSEKLELTKEDKRKIIKFCDELMLKEPKRAYYLNTIKSICQTGRRNIPCTAGYFMAYLAPNGDIFPCNIVDESFIMGNVKEETFSDIWFSQSNHLLRKRLSKYNYCKKCEDNCDYAIIIREEFYDFLKFMMIHPKILTKLILKLFQ